jgi:tryptophan halogenase
MKNAWTKNVLSVGLSTGFVEPLEATAIHMSIVQVDLFLKNYYSDHLDFTKESQHKNYNRAIGDTWDDIRDFIVAHYINTRQDTDFWKESSSKDRWSDRLKELMEMWSVRMPRVSDYSSSNHMDFYKLGNTLWYQVLIGMKILNPKVAENELKSYNLYDRAEKELVERNKFNRHILPFGENTNDFYKNKINNLYNYRKVD